eukprot:3130357-Prymnesium_polylepis.1
MDARHRAARATVHHQSAHGHRISAAPRRVRGPPADKALQGRHGKHGVMAGAHGLPPTLGK